MVAYQDDHIKLSLITHINSRAVVQTKTAYTSV